MSKQSDSNFTWKVVRVLLVSWLVYISAGDQLQAENSNNKSIFQGKRVALIGKESHQEFEIIRKHKESENTYIFRIKLDFDDQILGLPLGFTFFIHGKDFEGNPVKRQYSSLSGPFDEGHADILIKIYRPIPEKGIPGGRLTTYLDKLTIGDQLKISGPTGKLLYEEKGVFRFIDRKITKRYETVSFIAGGTGIAAFYRLINHMLKEPIAESVKKINLLYGSISIKDVLLKKELDALAEAHKDRLKVHFTVDRLDGREAELRKDWKGSVGYIDSNMIKRELPGNAQNHLVLVCGPPGMIKAVNFNLRNLKYDPSNVLIL